MHITATVTDTDLPSFLRGVLNTLVFLRVMAPVNARYLTDPLNSDFTYPSIATVAPHNAGDDITGITNGTNINREPTKWVDAKLHRILRKYNAQSRHQSSKANQDYLSDVYTKVILVTNLYNYNYKGNDKEKDKDKQSPVHLRHCDTWVITLDVLNTTIADTLNEHTIEYLKSSDKYDNDPSLFTFLKQDSQKRHDHVLSVYQSAIMDCLEDACDQIDKIGNSDSNNNINVEYYIKMTSKIDPTFYTSKYAMVEMDMLASRVGYDLEMVEKDLVDTEDDNDDDDDDDDDDKEQAGIPNLVSKPKNPYDMDLSKESIEYIRTTQNGDVILDTPSHSNSNSNSNSNSASFNHISQLNSNPNSNSNSNSQPDDIWQNGIKFFKKILE